MASPVCKDQSAEKHRIFPADTIKEYVLHLDWSISLRTIILVLFKQIQTKLFIINVLSDCSCLHFEIQDIGRHVYMGNVATNAVLRYMRTVQTQIRMY